MCVVVGKPCSIHAKYCTHVKKRKGSVLKVLNFNSAQFWSNYQIDRMTAITAILLSILLVCVFVFSQPQYSVYLPQRSFVYFFGALSESISFHRA